MHKLILTLALLISLPAVAAPNYTYTMATTTTQPVQYQQPVQYVQVMVPANQLQQMQNAGIQYTLIQQPVQQTQQYYAPQQYQQTQPQQSGYEKARNAMYNTTNTLYDVVNNVRALQTVFGSGYGY